MSLARSFANLMLKGKVRAVLRLISDQNSVGVLNLDQEINGVSVRDILKEKHPPAQLANPSILLPQANESINPHPVLFDRITGPPSKRGMFHHIKKNITNESNTHSKDEV